MVAKIESSGAFCDPKSNQKHETKSTINFLRNRAIETQGYDSVLTCYCAAIVLSYCICRFSDAIHHEVASGTVKK